MIEFIPDAKDIAKKIGKLVFDIYMDNSGDKMLLLSEDEIEYMYKLKEFGEQI